MKEFEGKVAIVLGGTSGIGAAVAKGFAEEGAITVVVGRNEERGRAVTDTITKNRGKAEFMKCDVLVEHDIANLMDDTANRFGKIDILIGNAGVGDNKVPLDEMTEKDFKSYMTTINTNLMAMIQSNRYALKHMMKNAGEKKGVIVNVASILSVIGDYDLSAYPTSKHGIAGFSKSLAVSYIKKGVRVNSVAPGYIDTPLLKNLPPELMQELVNRHPIGRLGTAEEVANLILFLCSDKSSYIVGANILIDGGYTAI